MSCTFSASEKVPSALKKVVFVCPGMSESHFAAYFSHKQFFKIRIHFFSFITLLYRPLSQCVVNNYYLLSCIIILNFLFTWQKDEFSEELVTVQKEERKGQEACEAVIKDKAEEQKQQVSLIGFVLF